MRDRDQASGADQIYENLLIAGIRIAEFTFLVQRRPSSESNWVRSVATFFAEVINFRLGSTKRTASTYHNNLKVCSSFSLLACFLHHPSQRAACYLVNPIFMGFALRLAPLNKLKMFFGIASQDDFEAAVLNIFIRSREFS